MPCKWGKNTEDLRNSTAWMCMYKIPLSLTAEVGRVGYYPMKINECLCTPENCRCYEDIDSCDCCKRVTDNLCDNCMERDMDDLFKD